MRELQERITDGLYRSRNVSAGVERKNLFYEASVDDNDDTRSPLVTQHHCSRVRHPLSTFNFLREYTIHNTH